MSLALPVDYLEVLRKDPKVQFAKSFGFGWYAKRTLLAFLKNFYSHGNNSGDHFVFYPDEAIRATQEIPPNSIRIEDRFVYDRDNPDSRPALVAVRHSTSFATKTITGSDLYRDFRSGERVVKTTKNIDMSVVAYSREGDEAEYLADMTADVLSSFREDIRKELGWEHFDAVGVGSETPLVVDSRIDYVSVPVQIQGMLSVTYVIGRKGRTFSTLAQCDEVQVADDKFKPIAKF